MNIGIDGNEANVESRVGSNHFAFELLWALAKQPSQDVFTVYLKSEPLPDMPPVLPGKWIYRVLKPGKLWTQWRLPLDLYLNRPRPDVFFTPGHYAPRFCPVPSVVTVLDLAFLKFPNLFLHYRRGAGQLKQWTAYSVKNAAHVITISQNSRRDILRYYKKPAAQVSVVYPGIDVRRYQAAPPQTITSVLDKYAIPETYILSVGTIQPRKNYVRLLKAFEKLPPRYKKYHLVISGARGWLTEDFDKTLAHLKTKDRVHVLGFIPDDDLIPLMSGAACIPLIGLYEGFGLPAAQAIACGSIPVVSDTASLPEVVGDGGLMVDPYSITSIRQGIMAGLRLKTEKRQERVNLGRRHIEQFNWPVAAKKILEVCHGLTIQK
jgi:glycosyltransferase involved in cell wall biosynthesis